MYALNKLHYRPEANIYASHVLIAVIYMFLQKKCIDHLFKALLESN
jgi:hypothetical protein